MLMEGLKLQVQSFFVELLGYLLIMLLGVLVGAILVYIPGVTELFASFTTLHPASILAMLMVFIKVLRG